MIGASSFWRLAVIALLLGFTLPALAQRHASPRSTKEAASKQTSQKQQAAEWVRSSAQLLGVTFEVTHERPSGTPFPPDLSRPKELLIPRAARFRVGLPVLWGEQVLAPGEYRLGIVVSEELEPFLRLKPSGGGQPRRLPLELGNYSSPSESGIVVTLASISTSKGDTGTLQIRWGAILFQGEFRPVRQSRSQVGIYRLSSFEFPRLPVMPRELPVGELDRQKSTRSDALTLLLGGPEGPRLRFEDRQYLKLLDERRLAQNDIAQKERTAASQAELQRARTKLRGIEARLAGFDQESTVRDVPGTKVEGAPLAKPTDGLDIRLVEVADRTYLALAIAGLTYRFPIDGRSD